MCQGFSDFYRFLASFRIGKQQGKIYPVSEVVQKETTDENPERKEPVI